MLSPSAVAGPSRRDRVVLAGCVAVVTALAWAYLIRLDGQMAASMGAGQMMEQMGMVMDRGWGASDLFFTFLMWSLMMVGMMLPAASPVLGLFARTQAGRGERYAGLAVLVFALGYLAVWVGFSAGATALQWMLHQAALLTPMAATSSPRLAGAILVAAGAYQLTPLKNRCLSHCQSPLGFLMGNWRDGLGGALRMGSRHGVYCLGCCWVLMGVLFAVGVMNLAWVALLTAVVLVEKMGPAGARLARVGGAMLIAYGAVVFVR